MRKNRRITNKMSVVATNSMRFGAILVLSCVMVVLNLLASSSCSQLMKRKGELERQLAKFEESRQRETVRWVGMCIPEKIDAALMRHGLSMHLPRADQIVRMDANGVPRPGQIALKRAEQTPFGAPRPARYRSRRR